MKCIRISVSSFNRMPLSCDPLSPSALSSCFVHAYSCHCKWEYNANGRKFCAIWMTLEAFNEHWHSETNERTTQWEWNKSYVCMTKPPVCKESRQNAERNESSILLFLLCRHSFIRSFINLTIFLFFSFRSFLLTHDVVRYLNPYCFI